MQNQRKGAMEIIQKEEYGITCLKIKGRMDMAVAIETEKAVDRILKGNNNRLLFDLGELEYLSSYGLRIILKAAKKIKMMDGKIILCSLLETDKEFFDICGFGANIPIADSVESGIKVLS
jgi:anti-anti-sigma factor